MAYIDEHFFVSDEEVRQIWRFLLLADLSASNNKLIRIFFRASRLLTLASRFAVDRDSAAASPALSAFTSAVRVVNWVLGRTANSRADAEPA